MSAQSAVPPVVPPLRAAYDRLLAAYGPQGWWPAASPFEVIIGAVLVQNTDWRNAVRAIDQVKREGRLAPQALFDLPVTDLEKLIQPAGAFRVKARRLRNVLALIFEGFGGSLDRMFELPTGELRKRLLAVNGVGPETADAILLYAAERPVFVVDAYARRVLERHGWLAGGESYDAVQQRFESALERDTQVFNDYHALLVEVGKRHCRPTPRCEGCPLEPMLPGA